MRELIACAFLGVLAVYVVLILLANKEVEQSKSRIARVLPLWYLSRRGPWWTRTVTLVIVFVVLLALAWWGSSLQS